MSYQVGDAIRCSATFRDPAGQLADPTTVQFKQKTPSGVETTFVYGTDDEVVRESMGSYYVDVYFTEGGTTQWRFRWVATGSVRSASENAIRVDKTEFSDPL